MLEHPRRATRQDTFNRGRGVHDADLAAVGVRVALAGVGQPSFFDDRQRVHVGADQDRRAHAVFKTPTTPWPPKRSIT